MKRSAWRRVLRTDGRSRAIRGKKDDIPGTALWFLALSALALSAAGQESERTEIRYRQKIYPLYPATLEQLPDIPSPLTAEDGTELVLATTRDGKSTLIPVTVENGAEYVYAQSGKGRQLDVDGTDFPTLARTGLHSAVELAQVKTITGRSVAEITEIGRPGNSSGAEFLSDDEDIVSVARGDHRLVKILGLTHPQMARPLFHIWNSILEPLHARRRCPENPPVHAYAQLRISMSCRLFRS